MTPLSIAFVIASLDQGGAERVVSIMANHWAGKGHAVHILTFGDGSEKPFYELSQDIVLIPMNILFPSHGMLSAVLNGVKRNRRIRETIKSLSPSVVISFIDTANIRTLLATAFLDIPVIISERTDPALHRIGKPWELLRLATYPLADAIVFQNAHVMNRFNPVVRRKGIIISNPVQSAKSVPKLQERRPVILGVGRLAPEKQFCDLLHAFSRLSEEFTTWSLEIAGDGEMRSALEDICHDLGISQRVCFWGAVRDVSRLYESASIFVLPSRYEGFPNALCEAMANGMACIATDTVGSSAIVRHGKDGVLVPVGDVDALTNALALLMSDNECRLRLGNEAARITDRYGEEAVMKSWDCVLSCVLE